MRTRSAWLALAVSLASAPALADVIVVDTTEDGISGQLCDIRDAINAANTDQGSGGCDGGDGDDVIDLTELEGAIELDSLPKSPLPTIQEDLTIRGPGADVLRIDGLDDTGIFEVGNATLTIEGLTIANGAADEDGGGIIVGEDGVLVLLDSRITSCSAQNGAGISNEGGVVRIERSVIDANAAGGAGGGIWNKAGTVDVVNSTISGNTAEEIGGGIMSDVGDATPLTRLYSTTLARNGADSGGNLYLGNDGENVLEMTHTLFADPTAGGNCAGAAPDSLDFNLATDASCALDEDDDQPNTAAGIETTLADNGGTVPTHALLEGSAAIDGGSVANCRDPSGAVLLVDQRGPGFPRRTDGDDDGIFACDVGATESAPEPGAALLALGSIAALARRRYSRPSAARRQESRCTSRSATR